MHNKEVIGWEGLPPTDSSTARGSAPEPLPGSVTDVQSDAGVETPSRLTQTINSLHPFSKQESWTNSCGLSYLEISAN